MFILKTIISFVVGGLLISTQSIISERVPLKWRGVILTLPTTSTIAFLFIGLTKQSADVVEVAKFFPASLAVCYIFVLFFALFYKIGLFLQSIFSFLIWSVCAFVIINYPPHSFITSIFIYSIPAIIIAYILIKKLPQKPNLVPIPFSLNLLLLRSLIGGSIVATAVVLAKLLGNIWGGLFSAFPAAFTSTFFIYYFAHGKEIIPSVAKSLFFPGSIGYIIYTLAIAYSFPHYGVWIGSILSYLVVIIFFITYQFLQKIKI